MFHDHPGVCIVRHYCHHVFVLVTILQICESLLLCLIVLQTFSLVVTRLLIRLLLMH